MLQRFADAGGRPGSVRDATVDVGLVVAVDGGMMIPVLPDLGGRSLAEIGIARRDATQRVRSGRLVAGDGAPVPIALSNLSRGGADRFEAIIGPGQSSVLAIGREHEAVVARGGAPVRGHRRPPDAVGRPPADRRRGRCDLPRPARRPDRIRSLAPRLTGA